MEPGDSCRVLIHKLNGDLTKHLQEEMPADILRLRKIKARKRKSPKNQENKEKRQPLLNL